MRIHALLSAQGTACVETALREHEDTPARRAAVERSCAGDRSADRPVPGTWTDVTDNDCIVASFEGEIVPAGPDPTGPEDAEYRAREFWRTLDSA